MVHVTELSGADLDYWVAQALGIPVQWRDGEWCRVIEGAGDDGQPGASAPFRPSVDWAVAGPILVAEQVGVMPIGENCWAVPYADYGGYLCWDWTSASPLEAAMRHLVGAHYGNDFDPAQKYEEQA